MVTCALKEGPSLNCALAEAIVNQLKVSKDDECQPQVWSGFSEKSWESTLPWLDISGLALYFRQRLATTEQLSLIPGPVRQRLDSCARANGIRAAAMVEELKTLNEIFIGVGIHPMVLKGITLVPDYCPNSAIRTQYDHDLLIQPESEDRAKHALEAAGYRRKNSETEEPAVYYRPNEKLRFATDFEALYSQRLARPIELHLRLWEQGGERIDINLPENFFERAVKRRVHDFEILCLSDEDALVFQVLHAFRHILRNWCRLSVFLEIAQFLKRRASDSDFWRRFVELTDTLRWAPEATAVVFDLAELLFGGPSPPEVRARQSSDSFAALTLWTRRYGRPAALTNFRSSKHSLFLHREFIKNPVIWAGIRRQRLFPTNRPHVPPAEVFQRGHSQWEKFCLNARHIVRRFGFHVRAALGYVWEYPRWMHYRKTGLSTRHATTEPVPRGVGAATRTSVQRN